MSNIFEEIERLKFEYETSTGLKPRRLYIGKIEVERIRRLMYSIQFNWSEHLDTPTITSGISVIGGLVVYIVNDDTPHMRCCL